MDMTSFPAEDMAGQRLMIGFDGTSLNDDLKYYMDSLRIGGIILFAGNIESPEQMKTLNSDVQQYAKQSGLPPLFIAIDQEGGTVSRLKPPFTQFPEGAAGIKTEKQAAMFADITSDELKSVGVNMDMAPVMDTAFRNINSIMEKRAFSHDPQTVADIGCRIIKHFQKKGIMAVAKHFPGIGRTVLDSHFELPILKTPFETLEASDLIPFNAAIDNNVDGIMLSHIQYEGMDPKWPASLSVNIARHLLREKMGYDGVVMTDDLDMKAIRHDMATCVNRILMADIDIVLICHKGPGIEEAFHRIIEYRKKSEDLHRLGEKSVQRILRLKRKYLGQDI